MVNPEFFKFISIKRNDQSLCFLVQWTLSKNAKKDKESKQLGGSVQWSVHPRPLTAQSQCFLTVWRIANFLCSHWWFLNAHQWTKCWSVNAKASETKLPTPDLWSPEAQESIILPCGFIIRSNTIELTVIYSKGYCECNL